MLRSADKIDPEARSYPPGPRSGSDLKNFWESPCKTCTKLEKRGIQTQNYAQKTNPVKYLQIYNAILQIRDPHGQI